MTRTTFDSSAVPLVEFRDTDPGVIPDIFPPMSPEYLLHLMLERRKYFGSPLPEGYVPPPGIDIETLLKKLPPE